MDVAPFSTSKIPSSITSVPSQPSEKDVPHGAKTSVKANGRARKGGNNGFNKDLI